MDVIVRNALGNAKQTTPERAASMGVVDVVLPAESFIEQSLSWAAGVVAGDTQVTRPVVERAEAWDEAVDRARTWVDGRLRGAAPAAYRALDLIAMAKTAAPDDAFTAAADAGADLVMTEQMRAAVYAYELTTHRTAASRVEEVPISSVGIVGAGMMAGQLAALVLRSLDVPVVVAHRNEAGVARVEPLELVLHTLALVLEVPAMRGFGGCRCIADTVAIVDGDRRPAFVAKNLTLIVADDHQNIEFRRRNGGLQPVHGIHGLLMAFRLRRGADLD